MLFNTSLQSSLFHLALLTMFLSYWKQLSLAGEMWDVWRKKTQRNRLGDLTWSSHKNLKNFPWNPAWDEKILPGNSSLDKGFQIFWEEFGLLIISPFLHKMFCIWIICKCKCTKNLFWGLFFWVFFVRLYACLFVFGVTQNYWNHHWFISSITILDQDVIHQKPTFGWDNTVACYPWARLFLRHRKILSSFIPWSFIYIRALTQGPKRKSTYCMNNYRKLMNALFLWLVPFTTRWLYCIIRKCTHV